jgi:hypothetical protein
LVAAIEIAGTANANLEAKTPRETLEPKPPPSRPARRS